MRGQREQAAVSDSGEKPTHAKLLTTLSTVLPHWGLVWVLPNNREQWIILSLEMRNYFPGYRMSIGKSEN